MSSSASCKETDLHRFRFVPNKMQQFTQIQKRSICGGIACVVSKKCKAWHLVIFHVLPGHDCAFPDHHLRMWDLKLNEIVPIPIQASLTNLQRKKIDCTHLGSGPTSGANSASRPNSSSSSVPMARHPMMICVSLSKDFADVVCPSALSKKNIPTVTFFPQWCTELPIKMRYA